MKIRTNKTLVGGIVFLFLSLALYLLLPSQIVTRETSRVTARTIPQLMILGMGLFSLILVVQGWFFEPKREYTIRPDLFTRPGFRGELRTLAFIAKLTVYALLFPVIGYMASTLLLVAGILAYYRCRTWWFYAIAFGNVVFVYFVFRMLLKVKLP